MGEEVRVSMLTFEHRACGVMIDDAPRMLAGIALLMKIPASCC